MKTRCMPILLTLLLLTLQPVCAGEEWKQTIVKYLESLAKPDGGYGWADQYDSHLIPTVEVIGAYTSLGLEPPRKNELAAYIRTHHPITGENAEAGKHAAELRHLLLNQISALKLLGEDVSSFAETVRGWNDVANYPKMYEQHGYPLFRQEAMAFAGRAYLNLSLGDISPKLTDYVVSRRRANGSFNNSPADDGSDGHAISTMIGVMAVRAGGKADPLAEKTVDWLRQCQLPCGGFTWQPKPEFGKMDNVIYTWVAVAALRMLGESPQKREACIDYVLSLWNEDGGFGLRPGLPSSPTATNLSLTTLETLNALDKLAAAPRRQVPRIESMPADLKIFTIQIQAQGNGSVAEAVELARALRIDMWGAKNSSARWMSAMRDLARTRTVPVTVFPSNEEYGTFITVPGFGTYSHVSDPCAPPQSDFGASLAGQNNTWARFRKDRLDPLHNAGGKMVWQICDNEELSSVLLDDSVLRGGYDAIACFHFNQNFVYMLPSLMNYRDRIPMVALQDAHGDEAWWWADDLTHYRTLFLAREASWQGWSEALAKNWVVAVRHDALTQFHTRMLGGAPGVQARAKEREADWKWWGDDPSDLRRPWASLVAVKAADEFEAGRPTQGIALRARCWHNGRGFPAQPVVEFVRLVLDGTEVKAELIEKKDAKGKVSDRYHQFHPNDLSPGKHSAILTVRHIARKVEQEVRLEFSP